MHTLSAGLVTGSRLIVSDLQLGTAFIVAIVDAVSTSWRDRRQRYLANVIQSECETLCPVGLERYLKGGRTASKFSL